MDVRFEGRPIYIGSNYFEFNAGERCDFPLHRHENSMELLFIAEGHCDYRIDGVPYRGKAGDIILFHQNVWHEEHSDPNGPFRFYYVGFHSLRLSGLPEGHLYSTHEHEPPIFSIAHQYDRIQALFRQLCEEAEAGWAEPLSGADLLLELLVLEVHRTKSHPSVPQGRPSPQSIVNRVRQRIEERYREPLTLQQLADEAYISSSYLSHLFQEQFGLSPIQYVIRQRMNAAKRFLATTDLTIVQIAEEVGYESATAFQSLFKKAVGVTPGQFRKERQVDVMHELS